MAINVSREKLLFYVAAGALGGFGAWGAAEPFMGVQNVYLRDLLLGAMIGLFIAGFLASIEALSVSQWRQAAAALIEAAIPDDTDLPETWETCAALLPHAQAVLALTCGGMFRIALYLGSSGNYLAARDLFQLIEAAYTQDDAYGAEHRGALSARLQWARWTGHAGDPAAARDLFGELLPVDERVFGLEHSETLTARHQLATWTGEAGDPAAARDQFAALLPVREKVLGPKHRDTLTTRHHVAASTGKAGDPAAARDQFAALLPVREEVLGSKHPRTLNTRHQLATWTGEAGDPAAARDQFAALLSVLEQVLGPEHQDTLTTRRELAHWTERAERGPSAS